MCVCVFGGALLPLEREAARGFSATQRHHERRAPWRISGKPPIGSARVQGGQAGGRIRKAIAFLESSPESERLSLLSYICLETVGPTRTDPELLEAAITPAPDALPWPSGRMLSRSRDKVA